MGSNVPVVNESMNEMICESPEFSGFSTQLQKLRS